MIYMFCTRVETEIVPPVLQIKAKTILRSQLVQRIDCQIKEIIDLSWIFFICKKQYIINILH